MNAQQYEAARPPRHPPGPIPGRRGDTPSCPPTAPATITRSRAYGRAALNGELTPSQGNLSSPPGVTEARTPADAALAYAACGLHVVPMHTAERGGCTCNKGTACGSPGKHPRTAHGVHDATCDPAIVGDWWRRWPRANLAFATGAVSGVVVVDVDPRNGGDLAALVAEHGPLPPGPVALTGRGDGGSHRWYRCPEGGLRSGPIAPGVDLLADGKVAVLPPSRHPSPQPGTDGRYRWVSGTEALELPELPAWVVAAHAPTSSSSTGGRSGSHRRSGRPLSAAQRDEFVDLWRSLGIDVDASGERAYCCAFHDDGRPSLSIDVDCGRWWCFPCSTGGGLCDLRLRVTGSADRERRGVKFSGSPAQPMDTPTEKFTPPAGLGCGVTRWCSRPGVDRWIHLPCRRKGCSDCGLMVRAQAGEHFGQRLAEAPGPVYRVTIPRKGWKSMTKRLTRASASYVRVPANDSAFVVLSTLPVGERVDDPKAAAQEACDDMPTDAAHVSSTRAWAMKAAKADQADPERWRAVGTLGVSMAKARAAAAAEGVGLVPVVPGAPTPGQAWNLVGLTDES